MANEKRLIYVQDAAKLLRGKCVAKYPNSFLMGLLASATEIEQMPTVDAVEVVHGRWIEKKLDNFRKWEVRCSECDWVGISNYDAYDEPYDFNYCPNCGAKMDGDEDGTD